MERIRLGETAAIEIYETRWWEGKSARDIAETQMRTEELICPFDVFHESVENTLGRDVFTHEFGSRGIEQLWAELIEGAPALPFVDIMKQLESYGKPVIAVIHKKGG